MKLRDRRLWILLAATLAFHVLLFLPRYLANAGHADFTPFFPDEHPHGQYAWNLRSAWEYLKALGLRRANQDAFRFAYELWWVVLLLVATARRSWRGWIRGGVAFGYAVGWTFLFYHYAIVYFFNRTPVLADDLPLAKNLYHLLTDLSFKWISLAFLLIAFIVGIGWAFERYAKHLQQWARDSEVASQRLVWAIAALVVVHGAASLTWFGIERDDPIVQLPTKLVAYNIARSARRRAQLRALKGQPPDARYDELGEVALARRPDIYLLMVEAYGEVLATSDLRGPYEQLMNSLEHRLAEKGLHARTAYSQAPVYGGGSWMSIATVQTGVPIRNQLLYDRMVHVSGRYPHLTRFFDAHGYTTVSIQPGNTHRPGLPRMDPFSRDILLEAPDLEYQGPAYGWGKIPDQYSLGFAREHVLDDAARPRFVFFMGVSTHAPWDGLPPLVDDWHVLDEGADTGTLPRPAQPPTDGVASDTRRRYFDTVAYDLEVIARLIEDTADDDTLFVILGDHQPAFRNEDRAPSYNAPMHVISRDEALIDAFANAGFEPGLFTEPGEPALNHEGVYSLLTSRLLRRYGTDSAALAATYYPHGAELTALNR